MSQWRKWCRQNPLFNFKNYWNFVKLYCVSCRLSSWTSYQRQTRMASGQLPGMHQKAPVASRFAWPKPHGLPCLGCDVGGLSQAPSETQVSHWSRRSVAGDLGQPATGTDQQLLKASSFTPRLKRCAGAGSGHFDSTKWLSSIRQTVHCVVSVMLFCCGLAQTFFSERKLLCGHAKISITSSRVGLLNAARSIT